ncbi:hypothetical protein BpHYR1_006798 [Brachionus plicatilis]|uniref:Uncharacterized protein n=1 Tax=Brachionus plicatilis TaxID=10195 RepID=A0A3M7PR07_BRAPC|nr:hypothetical protein BpHYR1_006798 [Brachionus plicatilis]
MTTTHQLSSRCLNSISFTNELSKKLQSARLEIDPEFEPQTFKENWMELAEIRPSIIEDDADEIVADKNYDFLPNRSNHTDEQLKLIENEWLTKLKEMFNDNNTFDKIPDIDPSSLNEK